MMRPGEILAQRYLIERELGRGAMGIVYLAHDTSHGRSVAIKTLNSASGSAIATERFVREIRTAAGLNHPNILPVHDSGQVGNVPYYVTPHVEGETLRNLLER